MAITLYEVAPTRSKRVRWALLELGVPFESISGMHLFGSDELRQVHPQGKIPAILDDGRPLFESAAICTWLADSHADKGLIAPSGTWERALHDQWCAFIMTELEAHLWSRARNTFVYPEEMRSNVVVAQADAEAVKTLQVLDQHLGAHDYFVADRFSMADIFAGFATQWAENAGLTGAAPNVAAYNARLRERPHCPLENDLPKQ